MRHPIHGLFPRSLPLGAAAVLALAFSACSKAPEPQVTETVSREEFDRLERELAKYRDAWDAANRAASGAGLETADLGARLLRQDARIQALEQELAAAKAAMASDAPAAGAPADGATAPGSPIAPPVAGSEATFTPEQVSTARRLIDEVERIKQQERQAETLKRGLARMNLSLTPEQENALLALNSKYQEKMREVFAGGGFQRTEEERLASQDKMEALRSAWENDLRNTVPGDVADKLIETAGRNGIPGFFPRRIDGTRRGGMNEAPMGNG